MIAVVVLLSFMQRSELSYWAGVALWALLLLTTITTAHLSMRNREGS